AISQLLGGLPLALDQAGAYILETPVSLQEYQEIYETTRQEVLAYRGENWEEYNYPESVATTWLLNFRQVGPDARELLSYFAFLAPDAIPKELVTECASLLGPVLGAVASNGSKLRSATRNLRKYSLITRDSNDEVFTIHRLVQAVMQDRMNNETKRQWA